MTATTKSLPQYSVKDEVMNSFTHLVGFFFSLGVLIFFIIKQITNNIVFLDMFPYYFYALTMMTVFFVSTFYHSSKLNSKMRAVLRIIDHCDIYLFVAGTYLPICAYGIENKSVALTIIIIEFVLAITGVLFNAIPNNSKILTILGYVIYIVDGWLLVFFFPFNVGIDPKVFLYILAGGIVYTIGAVTYAIGSKRIGFHSIFHVFVVVAAIVQFIGIYFLIS